MKLHDIEIPDYENFKVYGSRELLQKALTVVKKYFTTSKVTIGAICRKSTYMLMDLVKETDNNWILKIRYFDDDDKKFFVAIFICPAIIPTCLVFKIAPLRTRDISHCKDLLNNIFRKDKFVSYPVHYAKIRILSTDGVYFLHKSKGSEVNWWQLQITPGTTSFRDKLKLFCNGFKHDTATGETHHIVDYKVLDVAEDIPASVYDEWSNGLL